MARTERRLFRLVDLEDLSGAHLNRIRVRVTYDPTGEGTEFATLSTSLDDNGDVIIPDNIKEDAKPVSAQIVDVRGGLLQEVDLSDLDDIPSTELPLLEMGERLRDRLTDPQPKTTPKWSRQGRFTVLGQPTYSFRGFQLFVAVASLDELVETYHALGGEGETPARWHRPMEGGLAEMAKHNFRTARIGFDGQFSFETSVPDDAAGWTWLLSGPAIYAGFRKEPLNRSKDARIIIVLDPPSPSTDGQQPQTIEKSRESLPLDVTEAELVENAELFNDDPGPYCNPFQNPERVLGERRFRTVLRVEQPEIAAAAAVTRKREAIRAFEEMLNEDGETGAGVLDTGTGAIEIGSDLLDFGRAAERIGTLLSSSVLDPAGPGKGRSLPGLDNLIDWEGDTSDHQAVTVVGGHVLDWRVRWRSNGYSLGSVNHTLTLAPRQIKRIMKIDFARRETAIRREEVRFEEEVDQSTQASRDYLNAVRANLSEWARGSSRARSAGIGGGYGSASNVSAPVAEGVVVSGGSALGIGGAASIADSESSMSGERDVSASEEQKLRDAIRQHGESLRQLESTVITEISQEETVEGTSEIIANPNYCHALTVIYYNILRHIRVDTELAGVSECLFVPFSVTPFDTDVFNIAGRGRIAPGVQRVLRYRDVIRRHLRDRSLRWVFPYLDDYANKFEDRFGNVTVPEGRRADQELTTLRGEIHIKLSIHSPLKGDEDSDVLERLEDEAESQIRKKADLGKRIGKILAPFAPALGIGLSTASSFLAALPPEKRDKSFQRDVAPHMARELFNGLKLYAGSGESRKPVQADFTLDGNYREGEVHKVYFSVPNSELRGLTRAAIDEMVVDHDFNLPVHSVANVVEARIYFSTEHYKRTASTGRVVDDLLQKTKETLVIEGVKQEWSEPDLALLSFPLTAWEQRKLQEDIAKDIHRLLEHLNSHLHYYHKHIWWDMDRDELYTLLDGYMISNRDRRSIASVVEREPLGILGNMLVFQVARGAFIGVNGFDSLQNARAAYEQNARQAECHLMGKNGPVALSEDGPTVLT